MDISISSAGGEIKSEKGEMHISLHVQRAAAFASIMNKSLSGKSAHWEGQASALLQRKHKQTKKQGCFSSKVHHLLRGWTDSSAASGCSLAEVSAQSGWAVVRPELDEGVQEVSVQVGELFTGADLLQVVGGDHQEVTQGVECVEELQHQWNLDTLNNVHITYKVIFWNKKPVCLNADCDCFCADVFFFSLRRNLKM